MPEMGQSAQLLAVWTLGSLPLVVVLIVVFCARGTRKKRSPAPLTIRQNSNLTQADNELQIDSRGTGCPDLTSPASPLMKTISSPMKQYDARRAVTPLTLRRHQASSGSQTLPLSQARPPPATGTRVQIYKWLVEQHRHSLLNEAYKSADPKDYGANVPFDEDDDDDDPDDVNGSGQPQVIRQKKDSSNSIARPAGKGGSLQRSNSLALDLTLFDVDSHDQPADLTRLHGEPFAKSLDAAMFMRATYENVTPMLSTSPQLLVPTLAPRDSNFRTSSSSCSSTGSHQSALSADSDDLEQPGPYHLQSKRVAAYENVQPTNNDQPFIQLQAPDAPTAAAAATTPTQQDQSYENVQLQLSPSGGPAGRYENVTLSPVAPTSTLLKSFSNGGGGGGTAGDQGARLQARDNYENVPSSPGVMSAASEASTVSAANVRSETSPAVADTTATSPSSSSSQWYESRELQLKSDVPVAQNFTAVKEEDAMPSASTLLADGRATAGSTLSDTESDMDGTPLQTMTSESSGTGRNTSSGQSASTTLSGPYATLGPVGMPRLLENELASDVSTLQPSTQSSTMTATSGAYASLQRHPGLSSQPVVREDHELELEEEDYSRLDNKRMTRTLSMASTDTNPYGRVRVEENVHNDYDTIDQVTPDSSPDKAHDYDNLDSVARQEIIDRNASDMHARSASELMTTSESDAGVPESDHSQHHQQPVLHKGSGSSPSSSSPEKARSAQLLLPSSAEHYYTPDSGLDELTPYSTLSKTSNELADTSTHLGHSSTSSEVASSLSSQHWHLHHQHHHQQQQQQANTPTTNHHQRLFSNPILSSPVSAYTPAGTLPGGGGGHEDMTSPDVPHSPRPQLSSRISIESSSTAPHMYARGSPSLSLQSSLREESQTAIPQVPPGDNRPVHLRRHSSSQAPSSTTASHTEVEVVAAVDAANTAAAGNIENADTGIIEHIIAGDFQTDYEPQQNFILGPTQPMLITRRSLMMRSTTVKESDTQSFCGGQDDEDPKTYL
ncbi:serine-rich adhesin for platelets-like isoform X2 [Sycon ciliatum]|uniref:serine-rich adhesin for platelets-like isoform X2 n=1 Tax=Sycon ciliatum TaxID=27933 RepID=UPI0031F6C9CD